MVKKYRDALFHLRFFAKFIDLLIVVLLLFLLNKMGLIISLCYILISDMLFNGQSIGKKIFGIKVVNPRKDGEKCSLLESTLRNIPFVIVIILPYLPIFGWFLFFTIGIFILIFETYLSYSKDYHERIGDIIASTRCVNEN